MVEKSGQDSMPAGANPTTRDVWKEQKDKFERKGGKRKH